MARGRQTGSLTCQHMDSAASPSCRLAARVVVKVRMRNAQGTGYTEMRRLLCWEHYMRLENVARKSANFQVVDAQLFSPQGS